MTIKELYDSGVANAQSTIAGIRSFKEYCDSWSNKMMNFLEGTSSDLHDRDVISFTHSISENEQQILYITKEQYNAALEDEEAMIQLAINDIGGTVTVAAETVIDEIETNAAEVRCQGEFLQYLLDNETVRATEFLSAMRIKMQSAAGSIIDKYATLIVENNPLQSIRNFFELSKQNTPTKKNEGEENEYIALVSAAPYVGGNPWLVALDQVGKEVAAFFSGIVWPGILHIGEFFKSILAGVVKLIKWFISKIAKPISTNFEKCGPKDGIMDVPMVQIVIGSLVKTQDHGYVLQTSENLSSTYQNIKTNMQASSGREFFTFGAPKYKNFWSPTWEQVIRMSQQEIPLFIEELVKPLNYEIEAGQYVLRPYDVLIPSGGITFNLSADPSTARHTKDVVCRVGCTDNLQIALQLFIADEYDSWTNDNDNENFLIATRSIAEAYKYIVNLLGYCPGRHADNVYAEEWKTYYQDPLLNLLYDMSNIDITDESPLEWVSRIKALNYTSLVETDAWDSILKGFFYWSILSYLALMGPGFDTKYYPETSQSIYNLTWIRNQAMWLGSSEGTHTYYSEEYVDVSNMPDVIYIVNNFRPYSQFNMYNPVIHYQTFAERVSEAKTYIYAGIIAAAVVVTLVTVAHFRKRRKQKLHIASLVRDQAAYDIAHGDATVKDFYKADKKVKRISHMNALFGISSNNASVTEVGSSVAAITRQLISMQGYNEQTLNQECTLGTIKHLIDGF